MFLLTFLPRVQMFYTVNSHAPLALKQHSRVSVGGDMGEKSRDWGERGENGVTGVDFRNLGKPMNLDLRPIAQPVMGYGLWALPSKPNPRMG